MLIRLVSNPLTILSMVAHRRVSKDHASTSTSESGLVWRKGAPNRPDAAHLILRKEDKGLLSRIVPPVDT